MNLVGMLNGDLPAGELDQTSSGAISRNIGQSFAGMVATAVSGNGLGEMGITGAVVSGVDHGQKGGIDFNPARMDLNVMNGGRGIQYNLDPAMIQRLQNSTGFSPVIIDIQPMTATVPMFLGVNDGHPATEQLSMR